MRKPESGRFLSEFKEAREAGVESAIRDWRRRGQGGDEGPDHERPVQPLKGVQQGSQVT